MDEGLRICLTLQKWDCEQHKYLPYFIPVDWKICIEECDLNEYINCCNCGKEIEFGDSYSSQEIHTEIGLGFSVCEECHEAEMERKLRR